MLLFLLRHGDALDSPTLHDDERPLSDFGRQQVSTAAGFLHSLHPPLDTIFSSPLLRARQTAEVVREKFPGVPSTVSEYLAPMSNPLQIFRELNRTQARVVLLAGHEPFISTAISYLIAGHEHAKVEVRKSSLACVHLADPIEQGSGILRWIVTYEQMKIQGN
jgi:phosphohistidine phosphatase